MGPAPMADTGVNLMFDPVMDTQEPSPYSQNGTLRDPYRIGHLYTTRIVPSVQRHW